MLRIWTRHKDGTGEGWGVVTGRDFAAIRSEEQGNALVRTLERKYPKAEFYLSEERPRD